jgi:deoxyribonuclease-4
MVKHYVGAHISQDKTIIETMNNIKKAGGNALQIFVSNPRSTTLNNPEKYINISNDVKKYIVDNDFKLVIHSPYVINIANEFKNNKRTILIEDCYWVKLLIHELKIANSLGSVGVVLHVGKSVKLSYNQGLKNMKSCLDYIVKEMIKINLNTKIIIETPAGQGTELLTNLNDFIIFFNSFTDEQKKYLGICLDTAHIWALGYDLEDAYQILFKNTADYINIIHLNNSLINKGERKDRHAVMLNGKINNNDINNFILKLKKHNTIIILETPSVSYDKEFKHIYKILQ